MKLDFKDIQSKLSLGKQVTSICIARRFNLCQLVTMQLPTVVGGISCTILAKIFSSGERLFLVSN